MINFNTTAMSTTNKFQPVSVLSIQVMNYMQVILRMGPWISLDLFCLKMGLFIRGKFMGGRFGAMGLSMILIWIRRNRFGSVRREFSMFYSKNKGSISMLSLFRQVRSLKCPMIKDSPLRLNLLLNWSQSTISDPIRQSLRRAKKKVASGAHKKAASRASLTTNSTKTNQKNKQPHPLKK